MLDVPGDQIQQTRVLTLLKAGQLRKTNRAPAAIRALFIPENRLLLFPKVTFHCSGQNKHKQVLAGKVRVGWILVDSPYASGTLLS